jgi:hypothetical protein
MNDKPQPVDASANQTFGIAARVARSANCATLIEISKRSCTSALLLDIFVLTDLLNNLIAAENRWDQIIARDDWYTIVIPETQALLEAAKATPDAERTAYKQALYDYFETRLSVGAFALGSGTCNADIERKTIDTVVIHHTSNPPGTSPQRLSAIELMRLYGPHFANPPKEGEILKRTPLFSGHVRNGIQVFWPYHWIIRNNGLCDRLLYDHEIGWHAGNWEINCRSIAIALDDDYEFRTPGKNVLKAIAKLIRENYPKISAGSILGHCEIRLETVCPSRYFLNQSGRMGWRRELLAIMSEFQGDESLAA